MTEPINIPIDVNLRNTGGLTQLEARVAELRRQFRHLQGQIDTSFSGYTGGRGAFPPTPGGFFPPPPPNQPRPFPVQPMPAGHPLRVAQEHLQAGRALAQQATTQSNMALGRMNLQEYQQLQLMAGLASGQIQTPLRQAHAALGGPPSAAAQALQRAQMRHAQLVSILGQTPTPLQQAHHQLSTFGTPLQIAHGYQHSLGVAQAQQGLQQAQLVSLYAQMGPTPLQQAHAQLGTPIGPLTALQAAHAQLQAQRAAQTQAGLQQAQRISLMAQMGSQGAGGALGGAGGGGGLMAALGALMMLTQGGQEGLTQVQQGGAGGGGKGLLGGLLGAGTLGGLVKGGTGLAIGVSALQHLSAAMQAYETRHLGILQVGRQLDEQYTQVGDTLTYLQRAYQVTGQEGVAAMSAIGRVTGTVAAASVATTQAMRMARVTGMNPVDAAQMQAQLIQYSPTGTANPLALLGAYTQAQQRGELQRMSVGRFGEAAAQIAATGGFGRMMLTPEQAAEQTRMMAAFGGRYEADPAGAFQEYYARQYGPKSEMGETINFQAMADVMRANPEGVQWGDRTLHPQTSYIDQQILMQQGADIPAYRAAQFRRARQMAGGNRDLAIEQYMQATGTTDYAQGLREYEALAEQERTGGIAGRFKAPGAAATGEAVARQREARPHREGQDILERQMTPEELALTGVVKALEEARTRMLNGIQTTAEAFNTTTTAAEGVVKIFQDLMAAGDKLKTVVEEITRLPGQQGWSPGVAVPLNVDQWEQRNMPYPHPPTAPLPTQPRKSP